ncbi:MAG: type I methionyl aminopeptidase [Polyangiaceae bacterium]|nr:type I methionyl aminopeptidase [Polyangiaceae bacterium]NUQ75754.1 type I methionyl aminopeptidase [Polyangiaceae bacterium]
MSIDDQKDIDALKRVGAAVAAARDAMGASVAPGITTGELDAIGKKILEAHGARSAPQLAYGFPGTTCISVNDELAHGIPKPSRKLREGDLVNIDVSAELDGYWADSGASFPVGAVAPKANALLAATKQALSDAMVEARAGQPMRNIGRAVERRAKKAGFRVIRNLCGHGVGRHIHEKPSVPNTFDPRERTVLWEGLVITIEPFLTMSATEVIEDDDGWTLRTPDGSLGAQFEHTLVITRNQPIVIT